MKQRRRPARVSLPIFFAATVSLTASATQAPASAAPAGSMFPFVIPWDDATPGTATDVSFLNDGPAGSHGAIVVKGGKFVEAKTGKRVRFLGTNFTFQSDFPSHEDAEKVAAHIAKMGINIVRIHHHDADYGLLWDKKIGDHRHFDAAALDRLDYLIYQFKLHGVYVDLNLHVSRALTSADGLPASADKLAEMKGFDYDKRVDRFDRLMIQRQKEFAHDYLTHVNPYTRTAYAVEPSVAIVEINNENSLVSDAATNLAGQLADLPEPYHAELIGLWNDWLIKKYGTDDRLRAAWAGGRETPPGPSVLTASSRWSIEHQGDSVAEIASPGDVLYSPTPLFSPPAQIAIKKIDGTNWHVQAHLVGLTLKEGDSYTVRFEARADQPRTIGVDVRLNQPDWHNVGLDTTAKLTTEWKNFAYSFTVSGAVADKNRLSFVLGDKAGTVDLRDVSLSPGVAGSAAASGTLAAKNIGLLESGTLPARADWIRFLCDTERSYAEEMRDYLRKDLHVQANLIDTQISWSNAAGPYREQSMEFADNHSYWEHPRFPGKSWDSVNWNIANTPLVASLVKGGGSLAELASYRIAGKPYTITEYNEPAPNDFQCETVPELAAFAAAQDWDAFFLFDYGGYGAGAANDKVQSFFGIGSNPAKMAFMPAAALIFRGSALPPLRESMRLDLPEGKAVTALPISVYWKKAEAAANFGDLPPERLLQYQTSVQLVSGDGPAAVTTAARPKSSGSVGFTKLDLMTTGGGVFFATRNSEPGGVSGAASDTLSRSAVMRENPLDLCTAQAGFLGGLTVPFGSVATIAFGTWGNNFCAATVTCTGKDRDNLLLTLVGKVENTGMGWNAERTSVGNQWGTGPSKAEFIPATVTIPRAARGARVWSLDGSGKRMKEVPSKSDGGKLVFSTTPETASLWYEISVK